MGRHRRSAAGRAATGRAAAGTSLYADAYADTATGTSVNRSARGSHRRRKRAAAPVRTGLLGVSAAVAVGAVAVASGILPGGDNYRIGGGGSDRVEAAESPSELEPQGGESMSADARETGNTGRGTERSASPSASPSTSSAKPSATPSEKPSAKETGSGGTGSDSTTTSPSRTAEPESKQPASGSGEQPAESAAEALVLTLVNKERAEAGCSPVRADSGLAALAEHFSEDMAERGFFSHTDPDGDTPWDRAEAAGISDLGGENIARGQANAQSVMDAWMNSPGHRANILNCEYETMGVGAVFGSGGPWWTQDFGF
ncbi:cysteine-rich secretory protein family protein [Streptomyces jeddahensis]|uniref:Cysteine-rich secretory protein family protein n=2 Tax=Streptomyces jeddahensis TaxID=1716141 RepID=A0A177HV04_9ACTN|nr:CAP domain-containing protein [Streptomyces jeddahensis]OAH14802.1 cysteine-rich secretory protein family protein [Streptomyces jeddahensis]